MRSLPASDSVMTGALNRARFGEAEVADALEQPRVEAERRERQRRRFDGETARAPARGAPARSRGCGAAWAACANAREDAPPPRSASAAGSAVLEFKLYSASGRGT